MGTTKNNIIKINKNNFSQKPFVPGKSPIPVSGKVFREEEIMAGVKALMDGWWTDGKRAAEFESKLAGFIGKKFCTFVNSVSSANLLAITALTSFKIP